MIMKTQWVPLVGLAALLVLGCVAVRAAADEPSDEEVEKEAEAFNQRLRTDFKLPKMFDFERFKNNFKKRYHSAIEEMVRAKLYMGRAYSAFITAIKYKYRDSKYYLSVNSRSDRTKSELNKALNHKIINDDDDDDDKKESDIKVLKKGEEPAEEDEILEPLVDPGEIVDEVKRIHEHRDEPGYKELDEELSKMQPDQANSRRKREAEQSAARRRREPRADFELSEAYDRKKTTNNGRLDVKPASNNPKYQQPDVASEMSLKELEEQIPDWRQVNYRTIKWGYKRRRYDKLPVRGTHSTKDKPYLVSLTQGFVFKTKRMWRGLKEAYYAMEEPIVQKGEHSDSGFEDDDDDSEDDDDMDVDKPDVVWVDHRQSGCLQPVQDQGECGSCWAFATMAYYEFAYCNMTGSPVKFSEQYLLDCASHMDYVSGCEGGVPEMVAPFAHNYGLELARHYPYKGREEACPYETYTDPLSMGYIRVESSEIIRIPLEFFEEYLENTPIMIAINTEGDFHFYGGGIYDGRYCDNRGHHEVLLIGHGREDGEEYWIIRNSHSTDYGEQGHLRLNKNSDCIHPRRGNAFGQKFAGKVRVWAQRNWRVPEPIKKVLEEPANGAGNKRKNDSEAFRREMEMQRKREEERRKRNKTL